MTLPALPANKLRERRNFGGSESVRSSGARCTRDTDCACMQCGRNPPLRQLDRWNLFALGTPRGLSLRGIWMDTLVHLRLESAPIELPGRAKGAIARGHLDAQCPRFNHLERVCARVAGRSASTGSS